MDHSWLCKEPCPGCEIDKMGFTAKDDTFYFVQNMELEKVEMGYILLTLRQFEGNRTHAAKSLGISIRTLQRKIKQCSPYELEHYGIKVEA